MGRRRVFIKPEVPRGDASLTRRLAWWHRQLLSQRQMRERFANVICNAATEKTHDHGSLEYAPAPRIAR